MLVVAPLSILGVWEEEFQKFAAFPYSLAVLTGSSAKKLDTLRHMNGTALQVVVVNYESAWRLEKALTAWHPDLIIADEGHKIKTHNIAASKAMHRMGAKASYRLLLTGTVITNKAIDVFSQYKFLNPAIYGNSFYAFRNRYFDIVTKTATATNSIDLPVQVLEEGAAEYTSAPELSATFAPDTAVTVREFSGAQGLSIDCCMADIPVSEGYDFQAIYTVSIPLWNYQGNTLSGILTVPLPKGYDGATARINGGETAVSYTADTVSFRVTLAISDGTATTEFTIKAAAADNDIQPPKTGDSSHLWLWIAVMLAAGAALTGAVLSSRRRTYD